MAAGQNNHGQATALPFHTNGWSMLYFDGGRLKIGKLGSNTIDLKSAASPRIH